ncbi:MAG: F-type H+-transporting ATPase subunit delta [Frankiaceae bacterium]|jgi:F-type H+-transporting ATPase subunit delta|nr:F-type H+-transporting ATPase subunit delta [Frankiaceae bacterium]MDX6226260.1 F-type H+-transporting ATPase subunit delta [Frankiales bacterium]
MQGSSRASIATSRARLAELVGQTDASALSEDLFSVARLLDSEVQLRRVLADPSVPGEARAELAGRLLGDKVSATAVTLVSELVALRWSHPLDMVDAVESLAAQAAFQQALEAGTLDEVEDQLFRFARIVEREPRLRAALTNPALPAERKRELIDALLSAKVDPVALRIITASALAPSRRRTLDRSLEAFSQLSAELRQRIIARVTVAVAPDEAQLERLSAALGRGYGRAMDLQVEIDPRVLGGVIVRVGDEVLDGSVAQRLGRVRRDLGGSALAS